MKKNHLALFALSVLASSSVIAQDLDIELTNLTNGIHFTPILAAAHDANTRLFMAGSVASANLQIMAEGGDISGLSSDVQTASGDVAENPAAGLLAPGASVNFNMMTNNSNTQLTLTAMLLPTNDGFVGIDSLDIPTVAGTYTFFLNAYDAGTEANNEVVNGGGAAGVLGIPADPGGNAGTGGTGLTTVESNTTVHIHRGNLGDTGSGASDLDNTVHRWLNPVAKLVITVN
ncbi:MAG: spondin domain-containing protein [Gammaproteobacteria bacterium]|nr:spondin domain-containing protein [Gammaproteobacteria bacterium]